MRIIAHNIRSLHNVGAIFRNAAAFGVEKIYLTGITGTPPRKEIAKVALGAERMIPWETGDVFEIIEKLQKEKRQIIALENTKGAIDISETQGTWEETVLVLGNEVEGIAPEILQVCDQHVMIRMEKKRSLNVSVATGIALYAYKVK